MAQQIEETHKTSQLKYNDSFRKCAAIQIVFEYFSLVELIKMQRLNKRFYSYVTPGICPRVPLKKRQDYTELMRNQVTRVMLFSKQPNFYTFGHETSYKWATKPLLVIDHSNDLHKCPTEWPKNCQIAPNLWLFFGGGNPEESM